MYEYLEKVKTEMISDFINFNESSLTQKTPEEIIGSFLDWYLQRFRIAEIDDKYIVFDSVKETIVCGMSKNVPNSYQYVKEICDDMNKNFDEKEENEHYNDEDFFNFVKFMQNISKGEEE